MSAAEVAEHGTAAIALPAPDDDEDLLGDDQEDGDLEFDEDGPGDDDGELTDLAALAESWRSNAAEIRAEAARRLAEAQAEANRIAAAAEAEAERAEAEAREADEQAAEWQVLADRDAAIAAAAQETASLTAQRDALRAAEARLVAESDQLGARLGEFRAIREAAKEKLTAAPSIADPAESVRAVREANEDLAAIGMAEAPALSQADEVRRRLAEVRGAEEARGIRGELIQPARGLPAVELELTRLGERLKVLRREATGLPPEGEVAQIAIAVIAEVPEVTGAVRVLALPGMVEHLEQLAVSSPDEYAALRRHYLGGKPAEPERRPTWAEEMGLAPGQVAVPVRLPDGSVTMGFRV